MICNIEPPHSNPGATVMYNENKMDGSEGVRIPGQDALREIEESGHVLASRNIPEDMTLTEIFEKRMLDSVKKRRSGPPIRDVSFHMSVNPSADDRQLSEEEAVRMIDEVMKGLGYGNQPYKIYKHTDIKREHYHVVSCRIDENGKKIPADFDFHKLRKILLGLENKYGFKVATGEEQEKKQTERKQGEAEFPQKTKSGREVVPPFDRDSETSVTEQISAIVEDAMKWQFTTLEQFQALLLRRYRLIMDIEGREDSEPLVIFGANKKDEAVTKPILESDINMRLFERILKKANSTSMSSRKEQRQRLEKLIDLASDASSSFEEFRRTMEKKGVYVIVSFTRDGSPFGVTYLDRATRCAWKGSETARDLKWLRSVADDKNWTLTKDRMQLMRERRDSLPSRTAASSSKKARTAAATSGRGAKAEGLSRGGFGPKSSYTLAGGNGGTKKKGEDFDDEDDEDRRKKAPGQNEI